MKKRKRRHSAAASPRTAAPPAAPPALPIPEAGRTSIIRPIPLAAGLVLLAGAVAWRLIAGSSFANVSTSAYSADNLLQGVARDWPVIRSIVTGLIRLFCVENVLPALLLLLPAALLIAAGMAGMGRPGRDVLSFMKDRKTRRIVLAALFVVALAGSLVAHFTLVGTAPPVGDEFCYMFGADHLGAGRLYAESPPQRDHFQTWSVINDGRWYSKVTIGWPLLLALGRAVGAPFLVNALAAAFIVVLLFLVGERLFGAEGGLLAAVWGLAAPFFLMLSGTYFPHTVTALFGLLLLYLLIRMFETDAWRFAVLSGFTLAVLVLVRPADAAVLAAGFAPLALSFFVGSKKKGPAALKIAAAAAITLAGVGVLLAVNTIQNGQALLFGYQKYLAAERWGFGPNGHTLLRGLWHTAYSLMRAGAWGVPLIAPLAAVALFTGRRTNRLLLVPVLGGLALYAGYYTLAVFEFGPRYYLPVYLIALLPAAAGAVRVRDFLAAKRFAGANAFLASLALTAVLATGIGAWPRLAASVRSQISGLNDVSRELAAPAVEGPALIFLRDHRILKNTYLTRNFLDYAKSPHVYVLYLTPQENEKVLALFPDRKAYTTVVDPATGRFELVPFVDDGEIAFNYLAAGLNYVEFDVHKAALAFGKALELAPDQPTIMMNLARAQDLDGDRWAAVGLYARVLQSGETALRDQALFFLATDLRLLGERDEALKVYTELAGSGAGASYRDRAAAWVEQLAGK